MEFAMTAANENQRTYTADQVAEILGVSIRQVYKLCESTTDFKVLRMGKKCVRIHRASFDQWFDGFDVPLA